jgi:hypothetical protein
MKNLILVLFVFAFFFFTSLIFSQEIIISNFDIDKDGWTANGGIIYYHSSGGNPDGFIEFEDDQDGKGVFIAPSKFLGNLSNYDHGTINFDLKNTYDNGQDSLWGYGMVKITSSNSYAEKNVVPLGYYGEWTSFTIQMNAVDWGLTESGWDSLLADVTKISIQMDAQWNYYDKSALDNFAINPYSSDVEPELTDNYPSTYNLYQNYPNPFNPSTKISYQLPFGSNVSLKVYDILGNEIATLVDEYKPAGMYNVQFTMNNLPSGVYFYQLKVGEFIQTKKMVLLR